MKKISKAEARRMVQSRLSTVDESTHIRASLAVRCYIKTFLYENKPARAVLIYSPIAAWREIDLSPLVRQFPEIKFSVIPNNKNAQLPSDQYDTIFVPLYGFNGQKLRLGHGGGWYDRFLLTQPQSIKVGVGLELTQIDFADEHHDVAMDVIITDARIIR